MRILVIAPTPYFADRGCHVRIYEEARSLLSLGHDVRICTYHLGRDVSPVPVVRIWPIPWYRKESAGPSWHKPYLDVLLFFKALWIAICWRPDVIHAHLHEGAFIGFFLKKMLRVPMVFDCQGSLTGELLDHRFVRSESIMYKLFLALERWICARADQIIASSQAVGDVLANQFNIPHSQINIVDDGVDIEMFRRHPSRELRARLGIPDGKKVVVFLGALTAYQGIDFLLDCTVEILSQREDVHFVIMGYPAEEYRCKAEKMGVSHAVTFTGRIPYDQAPVYLSLGDIAVSPKMSKTEANGKLLNYMACELPTVVFDTSVNRSLLGDSGVYAPLGDLQGFCAKVGELLDNDVLRAKYARLVRQRAENVFSWECKGAELRKVFALNGK